MRIYCVITIIYNRFSIRWHTNIQLSNSGQKIINKKMVKANDNDLFDSTDIVHLFRVYTNVRTCVTKGGYTLSLGLPCLKL
jgi:hypothetical protein